MQFRTQRIVHGTIININIENAKLTPHESKINPLIGPHLVLPSQIIPKAIQNIVTTTKTGERIHKIGYSCEHRYRSTASVFIHFCMVILTNQVNLIKFCWRSWSKHKRLIPYRVCQVQQILISRSS